MTDLIDLIEADKAKLGALLTRWWSWHHAQPAFWQLFERFALQAAQAGRRKFSGWLITNRIRWESLVVQRREEDEYKISNDFIAVYTRLFIRTHPTYAYLFDTARMKRVADQEWDALWAKLGV